LPLFGHVGQQEQGGPEFDKFAFVDEFGNPNLDTSLADVSHYFIVSAVVVNGSELCEVRKDSGTIRKRHFQSGEMKSSSVGSQDNRRLRILEDIAKLPITFFSLAANKDSIRRDGGLVYKSPFLKFFHGQVYRRLYRAISSVAVISDEHGSNEFMTSFQKYVDSRHIRDLFNEQSFEFKPSKDDPLLQVADMISGSLARHFDIDKSSARSAEFLSALHPITAEISEWPIEYQPVGRDPSSLADDEAVEDVALEQAARFLVENQYSVEEEVYAQCCVVQYLLYQLRFVDRSAYIRTRELQDILLSEHGVETTEHRLRSSIIAPLRDAGLLIASSNKGYKIPVAVSEILDFVDHATNIVDPLLSRVKHARTQIILATAGKTDILNGERYEGLRKLLMN